jgi:Ca-activated chloride channel family protein
MKAKNLCARSARWLPSLAIALVGLVGCDSDTKSTQGLRVQNGLPFGALPETSEKEFNTEAYDHIVDNPFQLVAREPLSTFSSDVDTASYSNIRRFLMTEHKLPPKDAVRIEEMMNYFTYDYPAPTGEHPVAIHPELTICPWNAQHQLLRIGVQTRVIENANMPARNLVFLVDSSGSMSAENRLPLLKKSLKMLVEQLTERDRVGIVTYAGEARLVLEGTAGNDHRRIERAIDSLNSHGSTDGGGGIVMAYDLAQKNFIRGGLNRVILGTDGDFNVGVTNQGDLIRLIEEKRKSGVFLTVLGFGMGNLKDSTLEKLAHHGNGHYAYIDSEREARKVFVEQGAALITVAKDVKFQVEFNPRHVQAYRLVGYENRILRHEDFNNDEKDAGDLGSGHTVTVLYELVPPGEKISIPGVDPLKYQQELKPAPAGAGDEWLTIKLRYKDPEAEQSKLLAVPVEGASLRSEASADTRFAAAVASFGMLLRDSPYKGNSSFEAVQQNAKSATGADLYGHRKEFLTLVKTAQGMKR